MKNHKEKIYLYACFLPPDKFNSCILHNCDENPNNQKKKALVALNLQGRERNLPIEVKFKKIRQFKIPTKFIKENSVFKDWTEPNYKDLLERDLK
jgi:hypothetical protein